MRAPLPIVDQLPLKYLRNELGDYGATRDQGTARGIAQPCAYVGGRAAARVNDAREDHHRQSVARRLQDAQRGGFRAGQHLLSRTRDRADGRGPRRTPRTPVARIWLPLPLSAGAFDRAGHSRSRRSPARHQGLTAAARGASRIQPRALTTVAAITSAMP